MSTINRNYLTEYLECLIDSEGISVRHINGSVSEPDAMLTECNSGGLLIKLISDEAVICWRDWAGDEIIIPKICEITHEYTPDDEEEGSYLTFCFSFAGNQYQLNNFMRINH